ncbi:MAG: glycosyltransferase family 2 protein [Kiritimatiellae bacterium]|nr:glycosyltransferase family 2 protein [Kiritimatiellia bacterium]
MQLEKDQDRLDISVVVPVFNEEDNVATLLREIDAAVKPLEKTYEVIYVDDRSTDQSLEVLRKLKQENSSVRVLRHGINSGESAASLTGMAHARGDVIITMDADLQNDPADIPELLRNLSDDVAAVCGVRRKREDDFVKRISSKIANRFRNSVTGDRIADAGCTYRALRRSALRDIPVFNGLHRFLPTILRIQGFQVTEILVNHRPRTAGVSKYGVGNRAWRGVVDCFAIRWFRKRSVSALRYDGEE